MYIKNIIFFLKKIKIKISIFKNKISHLKYNLIVTYILFRNQNFISGYKNNFMILLNKINELIIYFS